MAWPEPLVLLLARADSRVSQGVRWSLRGLRASLQAVLLELPKDPGCEQLRALLAELESLFGPAEEKELPNAAQRAPEMAAGAAPVPRLLPLARAIAKDGRFHAELRCAPISEDSDDQIWNGVQRLLLRVPPPLAEEWRHRSQEFAAQAGGRLDEWAAVTLPLPWDEPLYPGLTGELRAAGLRAAPTAASDPRLGAVGRFSKPSHPDGEDLRVLASITSTCLWFVDHDPNLYHCLKSVFRFGMVPLTGEQRERYVAELLRRWERVRTASSQSQPLKEYLKALLDLDEALHSLVYQPAAAPDSWWTRLQDQARQALFPARDRAIQAGGAVHFQLLGGNFADINRLAPDSLQVDFGVPGEVSACLRIWARIDGEELKGRVLYRSPEEEP
jgi:hypothetical protein